MFKLKTYIQILLSIACALSVMSCTKEESGTLLGALGGALLGSAVTDDSSVGVALGTLAGAYIGRDLGRSLDDADQRRMYETTQSALQTGASGTSSQWYNPDNGNSGSVIPQPSYQNTQGQYCREYQQSVTIGGQVETAYGTACRQPDGTWKITNG